MTPTHPNLCTHQIEALAQLCEMAFKDGQGAPGAKFEETLVANEYAELYYRIIDKDDLSR